MLRRYSASAQIGVHMSFVRVTYVVPRDGQVERVKETLKKLSDFYATQPGYIEGYLLNPHPMATPPAMGRFGVWESDRAAEDGAAAPGGDHRHHHRAQHIVEPVQIGAEHPVPGCILHRRERRVVLDSREPLFLRGGDDPDRLSGYKTAHNR